jgi:disulfide bond formation protein DsbB
MSGSVTGSPPASAATSGASIWTWAAALAAVATLAGSLYLSLGMGLKACPLCFYQRTFVMGVTAILLVGLAAGAPRPGFLSLLALPLAVGGLAVAGWHEYLELKGALECPHGVLIPDGSPSNVGTAPQQSLAAHLLLVLFLVADVARGKPTKGSICLGLAGSAVLGGALALGAILSVPRTVVPDYDQPVDKDGCRPVRAAKGQ